MKFFLKVLYIVIFTSGVILGAMIWLAPNVIEKIFGSPTVLTAETR